MEPSRDAILTALEQVIDPELQRPVTELDMVRDVVVADGVVSLTIVLTVAGFPMRHPFEAPVGRALAGVRGVRGAAPLPAVVTPAGERAQSPQVPGGQDQGASVATL